MSGARDMPSVAACSLMILRTRRPKRSDNSDVCDAATMESCGCRARYHGGNSVDTYVDFADPGGMRTMSRVMSPRSIASSRSMRSSWCRAGCRSTRASASMHHVFRDVRMFLRCSSNAAACERDKEEVGVCGGGSREIMSDVMGLCWLSPASIEQRDSRRHAILGRFQRVHERLDGRARVLASERLDPLCPTSRIA